MENKKYEELYSQLYKKAEEIHNGNKIRLKRGVIAYIVLPFILALIRYITDSDKTFFLLLWVFGMFIISGIIIGVEYLDYKILNTLNECTDREAEFDDLVDVPAGELSERVRTRIAEKRAERELHEEERIEEEAKEIEAELEIELESSEGGEI